MLRRQHKGIRRLRKSDDVTSEHGFELRWLTAAREPTAASGAEFHHCPSGHFPVAKLKEARTWENLLSVRSECLAAALRLRAGPCVRGNRWRFPRTMYSLT